MLQPKAAIAQATVEKYAKYHDDPVGFASDVLQFDPVPLQRKVLESLLVPPYRVMVPSANEMGKSSSAAVAVLWWVCTRSPAIVLTTAPTARQVKDILWKEIRRLAKRAGLMGELPFLPKDCRIERAADDFAVGFTASGEASFQGQHGPSMLFVVDEAVGTDAWVLEAIEGMFSPPGHAMMCLFNPTKSGTWVQQELNRGERTGGKACHVVRMSALDHPNIAAELKGDPPVVPHAMRVGKFESLLKKWSNLVGCKPGSEAQLPTDVVWPPVDAVDYCQRTRQVPQVWRPGPVAEARLLGRFPRQGTNSVWSDGDWIAAVREGLPLLPLLLAVPQIGCDVARYGMDFTAFAVRVGARLLHFSEVNGNDLVTTSETVMELAKRYADWYARTRGNLTAAQREAHPIITEYDIPIKIDDDGVGGGVTDILKRAGYAVVAVHANNRAYATEEYPDRRSELWFVTSTRARTDELDLSGLVNDPNNPEKPMLENGEPVRMIKEHVLDELREQFASATYKLDHRARRMVSSKDDQKKAIKRSPDGADAINLAYYETLIKVDALPEVVYSRRDPFQRHR